MTEVDTDLACLMKVKERELFSKLDSTIRHHMRKQGLSLKILTYAGFDTEFNNLDACKNVLVSSQLAISSRVYFKIPKTPRYTISSFDTESNSVRKQSKSSAIFNFNKVANSIEMCISRIKVIQQGNYAESMLVMTECLKSIKGVTYYDDSEEYTLFALPRSMIQPYIILNQTSVSLKQLIQITSALSISYKEETTGILLSLIHKINSLELTLQQGKDKLMEQINEKVGGFSEFEDLSANSDKQLPPIEHTQSSKEPTAREKKLSRVYLKDLFQSGQKVSLTITNQYYLLAHLTQADLSLLSDFESVKEDLSIVNGSFVTLRDPLKYCDKIIHIRDTMLLAPAGAKSLAKIGSLYGEAFSKISIKQDQLCDMLSFLENDREKFILYALRDALITLIHSL